MLQANLQTSLLNRLAKKCICFVFWEIRLLDLHLGGWSWLGWGASVSKTDLVWLACLWKDVGYLNGLAEAVLFVISMSVLDYVDFWVVDAALHLNLLLLVVKKWMKGFHLLFVAVYRHLTPVDFVFDSLVARLRGNALVNHIEHIQTNFGELCSRSALRTLNINKTDRAIRYACH